MNGIALAHAVRDGRPPVAIVVASGRDVPAAGELPEQALYIRKPYRAEQVIAALRMAA